MDNVLEFVDYEGGAPLILTLVYILDSLNFWFKTGNSKEADTFYNIYLE